MISKLFSLIILVCLFPLFAIVIILILLDDGLPVFFKQKRVGKNNKFFWIYKFRTLKVDTPDIASHLLKDSHNFSTFFGPALRKMSIDELPQLINILKGEMVFIGPRPALYNQDDLINFRNEIGIHNLMPGITGWAQVNGRDDLSISQKVGLDQYYLNNKSFFLNLKIIYLTLWQIFFSKGISH